MILKLKTQQATARDCNNLYLFYKEIWHEGFHYKYPARFEWITKYNPELVSFKGIPIWIAILDDKIVGHTSAMFVQTKIFDQIYTSGMSIDTFVLPRARNLGVGTKLQKLNQDNHELFMSFRMSLINYTIKKKIGGTDGPEITDCAFIHNIKNFDTVSNVFKKLESKIPFLRRKSLQKIKAKLKIENTSQTILNSIFSRDLQKITNKKLIFSKIDKFDSIADEIWKQCRAQYEFAVERTSNYLNWKYVNQPGINYCNYLIQECKTNVGILVIRKSRHPEPDVGIIAELFFIDNKYEWIYESICYAVNELVSQNAGVIYYATAEKTHLKLLKKIGFKIIGSNYPVIHSKTINNIDFKKLSALISRGDHDWDRYPSARGPLIKELFFKKGKDIYWYQRKRLLYSKLSNTFTKKSTSNKKNQL